MKKFIIFILTLFAFSLVSCQKSRLAPDRHNYKHGGQNMVGKNAEGKKVREVLLPQYAKGKTL